MSCNAPTTNEFFDAPVPSLLSTTATPGQTTRARGTKTRTRKPATGTRNLTITPATSAPAASSGLSTGAKAGIGVGAALGAIAIIGLIAWFLLRRRKGKKDKPAGKPPEGQPTQQDYKYGQGYQGHTQPMFAHPVEADSTQMAELPQPGLESYADNMYGPKMNPSSNQQYPQELPTNPPGHLSPRPWSG